MCLWPICRNADDAALVLRCVFVKEKLGLEMRSKIEG